MWSRIGVVAVASALAVVAGLLTAPPSTAATLPASKTQIIQTILRETNDIRRGVGLAPLIHNTAIDTVAANWSQKQADAKTMSHNPNYAQQIPSGWSRAAENVAYGYRYTEVTTAWKNSPGHYKNMVGDYTDIGIGFAQTSDGTIYYTQNFGKYAGRSLSGPPTPVVVGNTLQDSRTGASWSAKAVNWPSFEYACQQGWGYSSAGASAAAAKAMTSWGITAVRIPLNQDCWLGVDGQPKYGSSSGYRSAIASFVSTLNAAGLVAILDLHWSGPAGTVADGQRAMPDAQSSTFWSQVASAYRGNGAVTFDLFNEPYSRDSFQLGWDCWKNGGCQAPVEADTSAGLSGSTYPVTGMASLVSTVRAAGAAQPILLGGLDYSNDLRGWLANRPNDDQLIASWHNYPGQRCSTVSCWNSEITPVAATVPVIATEFGQSDGGSKFLDAFLDWADGAGIGYAPWAWWSVSSDDSAESAAYALITDTNTFTPKAPSGVAYKNHLADAGRAKAEATGSDRSDFNGDGIADLLARNSAGTLLLYRGNGAGSVLPGLAINAGWNTVSGIFMISDFNGDHTTDIAARDGSGQLRLYRGDGKGGFGSVSSLGVGWDGMNSILSPGDVDGDGNADLVARDHNGNLWFYRGDGKGGIVGNRIWAGSGWNTLAEIVSVGDWNRDGRAELLGRDYSGNLWMYTADSTGAWTKRTLYNQGWGGYTKLIAPGDLNEDGRPDILALDSAGQLWFYATNAQGALVPRVLSSYGWNGVEIVN
ncbi:FG-GAP-like repeat-containing protein [Schumannella soli]|uniref:Cellulase family glycosylhydrolase n=1 Tax=Schumannella soli TaxID=2590779 RepID=A0A506Y7W2_9MICO|nr:FG-GAP-like repeat-containing protein [Schumannella soli]TPW77973.1 cellulase family glycosylhydrolase [Schumannella soli]